MCVVNAFTVTVFVMFVMSVCVYITRMTTKILRDEPQGPHARHAGAARAKADAMAVCKPPAPMEASAWHCRMGVGVPDRGVQQNAVFALDG